MPKAKPATRGAPPGTLPFSKDFPFFAPKGEEDPLPPEGGEEELSAERGVIAAVAFAVAVATNWMWTSCMGGRFKHKTVLGDVPQDIIEHS